MSTGAIILIVIVFVIGDVILFWLIRKHFKQKKALADWAGSVGLVFSEEKAGRYVGSQTVLSHPTEGWSVVLKAGSSSGGSNRTIWTDGAHPLPGGLALYAPPLPDKTKEMAGKLMENAGGLGRILLDGIIKGLGPRAADMRVVDRDDDPATLFATPGHESAFDQMVGAPELNSLNRFGSNIANAPMLVRNDNGLSLRINRIIRDTDELSAFIEAGKSLSARLSEGPAT